MKKNIILLSVFLITFFSCNNTSQNAAQSASKDTLLGNDFKREHTAQNSLDWIGNYQGTLPCADCEGIKTSIILHEDGRFSSVEEYLKTPNVIVETRGKFKWDESGSKIILQDHKDFKRSFKVVENAIIHLDTENNEIEGVLSERYKLHKE